MLFSFLLLMGFIKTAEAGLLLITVLKCSTAGVARNCCYHITSEVYQGS